MLLSKKQFVELIENIIAMDQQDKDVNSFLKHTLDTRTLCPFQSKHWETTDKMFAIIAGTDNDKLSWWLYEGRWQDEYDTPEKFYDYLMTQQ